MMSQLQRWITASLFLLLLGWAGIAWGAADSFEPDDTPETAKLIAAGQSQSRSIHAAGNVDWVKFTLPVSSGVVIETSGPSGDNEMWLYGPDSSSTLAPTPNYDDDSGAGSFAKIDHPTTNPLPAGTYYLKIQEYGNNSTINSYTLTLTVTPLNQPPVVSIVSPATGASFSAPATITIRAGVSDMDGEVTQVAFYRGTTLLGTDTTAPFSYTWTNVSAGTYSLTAKATDDDGALGTSTPVSVTVVTENTTPTAQSQSVSTPEDTARTITLAASDPNGQPLTYRIVTYPARGTLTGATPNVTYTPSPNYTGSDSFTFVANDGLVDSAAATVSITVSAVNDAPIALEQQLVTDSTAALPIRLGAADPEGSTLTYTIVTQPPVGTLSGTAPNLTYTPPSGWNGSPVQFTFRVRDSSGVYSNVAPVTITKIAAPTYNITTTYTYDYTVFPLGRLVSTQFENTTPTTYAYYEPSGLVSAVTTPRPGSITGETVTTTYTYDALGNLLTVTEPGFTGTDTLTTRTITPMTGVTTRQPPSASRLP